MIRYKRYIRPKGRYVDNMRKEEHLCEFEYMQVTRHV